MRGASEQCMEKEVGYPFIVFVYVFNSRLKIKLRAVVTDRQFSARYAAALEGESCLAFKSGVVPPHSYAHVPLIRRDPRKRGR